MLDPNGYLFPDRRISFQHGLYFYIFVFEIFGYHQFIPCKGCGGATELDLFFREGHPGSIAHLTVHIDIIVLSFFEAVRVEMEIDAVDMLGLCHSSTGKQDHDE